MKKAERKNSVLGAKSAFTLVEMLVVIAVIGLLAAISIPMISNVFGNAEEGKDKRNAQILASMASAAQAAGDATIAASGGDEAAANLVIAGVSGAGEFADTTFRVPNMSDVERDNALGHLTFSAGTLIYTPVDN